MTGTSLRLRLPLKPLALALSTSLLVACGNSIKPVTDADIQAAGSPQALEALYQKISAGLKEDPKDETLLASQAKLGDALAAYRIEDLQQTISAQRLDGILPVAAQQALDTQVESLARLSSGGYQKARSLLSAEQNKRQQHIDALTGRISNTPAGEPEKRFAASAEIFALDGAAAMRDARDQQLLSESLIQADVWYNNGEYDKAVQQLSLLQTLSDSDEIGEKLTRTRFKSRLAQLQNAQQSGDVEGLHRNLLAAAASTEDERFQVQLTPYAVELMHYYNLMAQTALSEQNLHQAYSHLQRLKAVSPLISADELDQSATTEFLSQIYLNAQDAVASNKPAMTFAYLKVMADFDQITEEQSGMLSQSEQQLYDRSVIKLAASQFDSPSNAPGLGSLITAALVEHFVKADRKDIRVLERDSIDSVLKEQEIKALKDGGEINLSSADFLIQGAVLEANVDESSQQVRKTKRVVTELETSPNPEFQRWLKLTDAERARQPRPLENVEKEVRENISFAVTQHRKLGSVTTSFRIINPDNAKLLHAETLSAEEKHDGSSVEGLEIGMYRQAAETADLPANQQILRNLTRTQAGEIASKLVQHLKNPEDRYLAQAQIQSAAGDHGVAVEELGKAIVLRQVKGKSTGEQLELLKSIALQVE